MDQQLADENSGFNFDNIEFKAMTNGLGFHQDKKKNNFKKSSVKSVSHHPTIINPTENQVQRSSLDSFYKDRSSKKITSPIPAKYNDVKKEISSVGILVQFSAWVVDVFFISLFVALTFILFAITSGFQLKVVLELVTSFEIILFGLGMFSLYYLLFFSILDLSASPGKQLLGIKVESLNGKRVSLKNTTIRALVTLVSVFVLFFPLLLDFQGKISDTKLVK